VSEHKIVSIHQPQYWPWLGLIDKIMKSDIHVVLDDVKFNTDGFQHRTLYRVYNSDKSKYLTIPYDKKTKRDKISAVRIDVDDTWQREHLRLIKLSYKRTPFFEEIFPYIETIFVKKYSFLADLNLDILKLLLELFEIDVVMILSSELNSHEKKDALTLDLTKKAKGSVYLSGQGAKDYMNNSIFKKSGIGLMYQNFVHPTYQQSKGKIVPGLFSLDLLFNAGLNVSKILLRENLQKEQDEVIY